MLIQYRDSQVVEPEGEVSDPPEKGQFFLGEIGKWRGRESVAVLR